ncbi:MAG: virulence protein SciE type [gamma proteobacterium symbiont of Stewartia floridana]|nr:MAG: virulence protein SciE type [gamma proteobacterium symbiont of Stewartia floridana]RLW65949.1 MAG: virulence protein SciE type [gamma proteobacterium symbiont of Stewartia floridana]RLW66940.1 MAG: virulence protein SciE type [gamma proteobacterium symbiont of Stewartia floridana]
MTGAKELLQQGQLDQALETLQQSIRNAPSDTKLRVFLFQLLCVMGAWERALSQLQVAGDMDSLNLPMAQTYREAIRCELFRQEVFSGDKTPLIFGDPPEWTAFLVEAMKHTGKGEYSQAESLRNQAFELAPTTPGTIDGQAFEWIADADSRLGPMIEAIVNGRYYWIPMQRLKKVTMEAPEDLRDMVWTPAQLTFENEGESVALIPSRYPGTESASEPALKLSHKTEWQTPAEGVYLGLGQRMLATDQDDYPLLNVREIQFQSATDSEIE